MLTFRIKVKSGFLIHIYIYTYIQTDTHRVVYKSRRSSGPCNISRPCSSRRYHPLARRQHPLAVEASSTASNHDNNKQGLGFTPTVFTSQETCTVEKVSELTHPMLLLLPSNTASPHGRQPPSVSPIASLELKPSGTYSTQINTTRSVFLTDLVCYEQFFSVDVWVTHLTAAGVRVDWTDARWPPLDVSGRPL